MNRSLVLAVAAGAVGLIVGRVLPRGEQSLGMRRVAVPPSPVAAPADCMAARNELASTRARLAICLAIREPPTDPEPAPVPTTAAPPLEGMALLAAEAKKFRQRHEGYPEAVFVRHKDGTTGVYRPEEWPPESEDIYAKKLPNGYIVYYAGPDVGPRSDPSAWVDLSDLAGPDGVLTLPSGGRIRFQRPEDAGP